jgi:hypothetical protein
MRYERASLTMEELRNHARIIREGSFDDAEHSIERENNDGEEAMDPEMKALLEGETSSHMHGTHSSPNNNNNNNYYNLLMTSYSVLATETLEQPKKSISLPNCHKTTSTTSRPPCKVKIQQQQASGLIRPHHEFARSDSGLETSKVSRVERSWLVIAESNRIEEVGEKIFFRYVWDKAIFYER